MKKPTYLYLPAFILFIFAIAVLVVHFSWMPERWRNSTRDLTLPFSYNNGQVLSTRPEAEQAGIKVGDRTLTMNGQSINNESVCREEWAKSQETGQINLTIQRKINDTEKETKEINVQLVKVEKNFSYYAKLIVGFIYNYFIPAF